MTKSSRFGAVIALGLIASTALLPLTPAAADGTPLPGIGSVAKAHCTPGTARGPLGY